MASPAYQRIHSVIRKRIESRQLRIGDAVGSERDLAKIHQVSLMTARHALATLEREGLVERRRAWHTQVELLNQGKAVFMSWDFIARTATKLLIRRFG
jgi:DNA-binding GntR family transcriptional regulator